jgi:hypothetical protein
MGGCGCWCWHIMHDNGRGARCDRTSRSGRFHTTVAVSVPFPHHPIPLDGRRTERSWSIPSPDCAPVTAVRWESPRKFSTFALKSRNLIIPDSLLSLSMSVVAPLPYCRPAFLAPSSLHAICGLFIINIGFFATSSVFTPVTDHLSSMLGSPCSLKSAVLFFRACHSRPLTSGSQRSSAVDVDHVVHSMP